MTAATGAGAVDPFDAVEPVVAEPVVVERKPERLRATAAFGERDFALFWSAALVSNTGTWMQGVALPFVLFNLTGSAAWAGLAGFAQLFPAVLMGPLGGSLADRFDRRRMLLVTQSLLGVSAAVLWALWVSGNATPVAILVVVAAGGVVSGINIPNWQAFVSELVPRSLLLNAVTLNSAQFNAARALGPALGGIALAVLGPGWVFLLNALSFLAVIAALLLIRKRRRAVTPQAVAMRPKVLREFRGTIAYVRARPGISECVLVVTTIGLLGSPLFQLLVVFADDVFDVGRFAYGLLGASIGIGAILGTPLIAGRGSETRRSTMTGAALVMYGASILLFGIAPAYVFGLVALLFSGAAYLALASTLNTTVQLQVDEAMRGKTIALYLMGLTASAPIGALVQGWLVDVFGPRVVVTTAGAGLLAVALVLRSSGRLRRMDDSGPVVAV
jgi:MFS family permease